MRTNEAIKHPLFGTQVALAEALGLKQPTIATWGEFPPAVHQLRIEALTGLRAEDAAVAEYPELAAAVRGSRALRSERVA